MIHKILKAKNYIETKVAFKPELCIVLGSGLGDLADEIEDSVNIEYKEIPGFPETTVHGHVGKLICGVLEGRVVMAMQGRFHYYEGYSMDDVTFFVRVMRALGIEKIILTNAAGGLRLDLTPGSLMILSDHINMTGTNPLIGKNYDELGTRFPDLSEAYDKEFIQLAKQSAKNVGVDVHEGVYAAISGPSYSTKAELNMLITVGADAIGMSTAPETIVAVHSGMRVLGISCITDCSNPSVMTAPSHEEIVKIANETKPKFIKLLKEIIKQI